MRRVSPTRYQALAAIAAAAFVGIPTELPSRQVSVGVLGMLRNHSFPRHFAWQFQQKENCHPAAEVAKAKQASSCADCC